MTEYTPTMTDQDARTERCSNPKCPLPRAHSGPCAPEGWQDASAEAERRLTPEFESVEQELFKHQPVMSMRDGGIVGCQCLDRVFVAKSEDWGTHLADVFLDMRTAVLAEVRAGIEALHETRVQTRSGGFQVVSKFDALAVLDRAAEKADGNG